MHSSKFIDHLNDHYLELYQVGCWSPFCLVLLGRTMMEVMKKMVISFKRSHACTAALSAPSPAAGHRWPTPLPETPGHSQSSGLWQDFSGPDFTLSFKNQTPVTSLVVQELRIRLQCRGHWFNPWFGNQDPTCRGATKPAHCSYMPRLENFLCYKENILMTQQRSHVPQLRPYATKNETNKQKQVFRKTDWCWDQHQARTRGEFPDHGGVVRYSFWTRRSL